MKRLSIDRSGGQTQNFKQRIKLFARNLLIVVMLSRIAFLRETKENVVLHDGMSFSRNCRWDAALRSAQAHCASRTPALHWKQSTKHHEKRQQPQTFVETLAQDDAVSSMSIELFCITRLLDGLSESLAPMS